MATVEGKKTGGRAAGTPNKKTQDILAQLEELGYSPIVEAVKAARIAKKEYKRAAEIFDAIQDKRADYKLIPLSQSEATEYLKVMLDSATKIMPYVYPKRKAIEFKDPDGVLKQTLTELFGGDGD